MNPNEFGLYMIILPHEARFCTIFGKIFKENEKSQPLWLTLNDLYFALNMDFQRKNPIFAYKTSYFQFGTLKYIDVIFFCGKRGLLPAIFCGFERNHYFCKIYGHNPEITEITYGNSCKFNQTFLRLESRQRPQADRALPPEDQSGVPFDRSPFERRTA